MFTLVEHIVRAKRGGGMKEMCIFMFRYVHPCSVHCELWDRGEGKYEGSGHEVWRRCSSAHDVTEKGTKRKGHCYAGIRKTLSKDDIDRVQNDTTPPPTLSPCSKSP